MKEEVSDWLKRPFKEEEIFKALKLYGRDKALGVDGFTSAFFMDHRR